MIQTIKCKYIKINIFYFYLAENLTKFFNNTD